MHQSAGSKVALGNLFVKVTPCVPFPSVVVPMTTAPYQSAPPPSFARPAMPANEESRLAALHALSLLDSGADSRFDRLTELAADFFTVPIAVVSLVDANRQWFKSACGLSVKETPRDISFCGHAIHEEALLVVEDATLDPRFANNPLVLGPPHVCFYAGAVLRDVSSHAIGTLCLIDSKPRVFSEQDRRRLVSFGELVEQEVAHHTDILHLRGVLTQLELETTL